MGKISRVQYQHSLFCHVIFFHFNRTRFMTDLKSSTALLPPAKLIRGNSSARFLTKDRQKMLKGLWMETKEKVKTFTLGDKRKHVRGQQEQNQGEIENSCDGKHIGRVCSLRERKTTLAMAIYLCPLSPIFFSFTPIENIEDGLKHAKNL